MWIAYLALSLGSLYMYFFGVRAEKKLLWLAFTFAGACVAAMCCVMSLSVVEAAREAITSYHNELCATIALCLLFATLADRFEQSA